MRTLVAGGPAIKVGKGLTLNPIHPTPYNLSCVNIRKGNEAVKKNVIGIFDFCLFRMVVFVWVIVFSRLMAQVSLEPIIKGKYRWISISLAGNNFASSGIKTSGQGSSANRHWPCSLGYQHVVCIGQSKCKGLNELCHGTFAVFLPKTFKEILLSNLYSSRNPCNGI